MKIPIDRALISQLVSEKFGSFDGFVEHWHTLAHTNPRLPDQPRERGTIYRWFDDGIPSNSDAVFGFAAALEIDPVALLPIGKDFIRKFFPAERSIIQHVMASQTPLKPLHALYLPAWKWPNPALACPYPTGVWTTKEFSHDVREGTNYYAKIIVEASSDGWKIEPRTFHIAYMRKNALDRLWRPYGTIFMRPERHIADSDASGRSFQ